LTGTDSTLTANADAAQRLYEALRGGDRDTLAVLLHPEFVGHTTAGLPLDLGGEYSGPDEMQRDFWWRIGRHYVAEAHPDDMRRLDDGRLFVRGRYRGHGRESGGPLDAEFIHVLTFATDGTIVRLDQLTDSASWVAALEPAGAPQVIEYSVSGGVATICLNRPEARNAIDMRMGEETLRVAQLVAEDPTVRAVLICGNGPALTVGGDIDYFLTTPPDRFGSLFARMTTPFHEAFRILSRIDAPIVTAAHGAVAGGGLGYVYAADLVVAAEGTKFVTGFADLGLSGDGGGTWHLPRLIGARRAAEVYLRNAPIGADDALRWGMVNAVVPADELRSHATRLAADLAAGPTRAYGRMRALLRETWSRDLSEQLLAETEGMRALGGSADAADAITAFVAKRKPRFTGR
jgi:2-(1,2-epoxy-1,2-dihydrophenyl)acetyl-CoA isomerase